MKAPTAAATHCRQALESIEQALAARPADPRPKLSECVQALAAARDALIEARRRQTAGSVDAVDRADPADPPAPPDPGTLLRQINATLSQVAGCEYPIKGTRWSRIEQARDALARLAAALAG